ncbi:hypothetical protein AB0G71_07155 [Streptomyces sp. NPDC020403]|uniref:hypothetical protein n=1 Tax=unclassified Streptomyces TaxID=2593676 RepID=UPI0033DA95F6
MVISRRGMRGGLLGAAVAGSLVFGAAGCSDDEKDYAAEARKQSVPATELCGGHAVSAAAGQGLETITGSPRFEASGEEYTVARAAQELSDTFTSSATGHGDVCRIYPPVGTAGGELRITWHLSPETPGDAPAAKYTVLKMGERAGAAPDGAFVDFACRGGDLSGSSPAHINIAVEPGGMPEEPEDDIEELKNAYATVAHSFSLAMAKELGCEGDGGLQARPSLDPAGTR